MTSSTAAILNFLNFFDFFDDVINYHALMVMMRDNSVIFLKPTYIGIYPCKMHQFIAQSGHLKIFDDGMVRLLEKVDLSNGCCVNR